MSHAYRPSTINIEAAWADWPESITTAANAAVFHISKGDPAAALTLLQEMLADLDLRRRMVAEITDGAD